MERTFFVTTVTWARRPLFRSDPLAKLLVDTLFHYRDRYLLHEFVIMPDHIHLLLTPDMTLSLERAVQLIKGGFSFRARRGSKSEIWQPSFTNHRIRDTEDYSVHRAYIHNNPLKRGLALTADEFAYSSANPAFHLDPAPPGLEPSVHAA
jgi:putative transposase